MAIVYILLETKHWRWRSDQYLLHNRNLDKRLYLPFQRLLLK